MDPITLSLIAAGLSAGASGLGSYFANRGQSNNEQINRFTPNQNLLQDQSISKILEQLKQPGGGFAPIEENARKNFAQNTLPTIANRYTSQFGPGNMNGSPYNQIKTQAQSDFEKELLAMRANFENNRFSNLLSFSGQPRFDTVHTPGSQGAFGSALAGLAPTVGAAIPLLGANNQTPGMGQDTGNLNNQNDISKILAELIKNNSFGGSNTGTGGGFTNQAALPGNLNTLRSAGF